MSFLKQNSLKSLTNSRFSSEFLTSVSLQKLQQKLFSGLNNLHLQKIKLMEKLNQLEENKQHLQVQKQIRLNKIQLKKNKLIKQQQNIKNIKEEEYRRQKQKYYQFKMVLRQLEQQQQQNKIPAQHETQILVEILEMRKKKRQLQHKVINLEVNEEVIKANGTYKQLYQRIVKLNSQIQAKQKQEAQETKELQLKINSIKYQQNPQDSNTNNEEGEVTLNELQQYIIGQQQAKKQLMNDLIQLREQYEVTQDKNRQIQELFKLIEKYYDSYNPMQGQK